MQWNTERGSTKYEHGKEVGEHLIRDKVVTQLADGPTEQQLKGQVVGLTYLPLYAVCRTRLLWLHEMQRHDTGRAAACGGGHAFSGDRKR